MEGDIEEKECSLCSKLENYIKCSGNMSSAVLYSSRDYTLMNSVFDILLHSSPPHIDVIGLKGFVPFKAAQPSPPMGVVFLVLFSLRCCSNGHFEITH